MITTQLQSSDNGEVSRLALNANFVALEDAIETVINSGALLATTTIKGRVKLATAPADANEPTAVGTNDPRLNTTTGLNATGEAFIASVTGMIMMYGSTTPPTGFLLCNGQAVSRTTYSSLFSVISTSFGIGDGSTTFNVPNLAARFPLGYSAAAPTKVLTFASRSSNVITVTGADNHAHNEIQTGQAVLYSAPSGAMTGLTHNTTYYLIRTGNLTFSLASSLANAQNGTVISLSSDGTGAQTFTLTYTARSLGHTGGEENHAMTSTELLSHTHLLSWFTGNTGGADDYPFGALDNNNAAAVTKNPGNTGGNTAMNNMPLFTVVNYVIKT